MSRIFDNVEAKSSRRKAHILDTSPAKHIFEGTDVGGGGSVEIAVFGGTDFENIGEDSMKTVRIVVDSIWLCCVLCILAPVCSFVVDAVQAEAVTISMTGIPYKCSLFYLGLFVGLPGASVYVFCCTLIFFRRGKVGIFLCMLCIFVFVCTVEQTCMLTVHSNGSINFYMLGVSVVAGIGSQCVFVVLMSMPDARKHIHFVALGLGGVLVLLSMLAVALAGTKFDENYTRASCYITSVPLAAGVVVFVASTYSTLSPIRNVCRLS